MPPRKKTAPAGSTPHVPPVLDWQITDRMKVNGRHVEPGTELKIAGEPGRYRFIRHVARPDGREWIDVIGGPKGAESWRSFRPERVQTVHRINRTRANAA